jgi:hypothetical protein
MAVPRARKPGHHLGEVLSRQIDRANLALHVGIVLRKQRADPHRVGALEGDRVRAHLAVL